MSDGLLFTIFISIILGSISGAYAAGKHMEHKKHQWACSPEVLVAYTDGYRECKEGK